MEPAMNILEGALAFLVEIMTLSNEPLVLVGAGFLFILGLILLYKKGPWLGIPFSLAGIFVVLMAILAEILSSWAS